MSDDDMSEPVPLDQLGLPGRRARERVLAVLEAQVAALDLARLHAAAVKYVPGPASAMNGEPGGGSHATSSVPLRLSDRGPVEDPILRDLSVWSRAVDRATQAIAEALVAQARICTVAPYQDDDDGVCPEDACQVMWRVNAFEVAKGAGATDVGGVLPEPLRICDPVYRFVRTRGRIPSKDECRHYQERGKWPVQHVDTRSKGKKRRARS